MLKHILIPFYLILISHTSMIFANEKKDESSTNQNTLSASEKEIDEEYILGF